MNQEAWHPPGDFVNALSTFLDALQKASGVYERLEINERYFAKGSFVYDLSDLLEAARWALEQGDVVPLLTPLPSSVSVWEFGE